MVTEQLPQMMTSVKWATAILDDIRWLIQVPLTHNVKVHIHNKYVKWLNELKSDIMEAPGKVSVTSDGWSEDKTRAVYLGTTATWIQVKEGKWRLRSEVIGFQGVSGNHTGENLGQYLVGCLDHVGIMGPDHTKTQASGQQIEAFEKCQTQQGIEDPVKIPLHSNIQWGSAHVMLDCAYELRQL
ncbi:hypothetical protein DXG01_007641 [Tephrocybe rancida]|nr:hypothetical protein DXG01_007641 [Tephrocybe rancida]